MIFKIPKVFYDDHTVTCELPAPEVIKETKSHYYIDSTSNHLAELLSNAKHYSDCAGQGWDFGNQLGMQSSARATVKAINKLTPISQDA